MAYRYCPECERWLEPIDFTVNKNGETICPEHDVALHGHMPSLPLVRNEQRLRRQVVIDTEEIEAAREQGLI
jgi:hypothetical protein